MRRSILLVSAMMVGAMLTAPAVAQEAMFRCTPQLTGVCGAQTPRHLEGVRFRFNAGAPLRNAPVVTGGRLYVGAADGAFYALDARTGAQVWRATTGVPVTSAAAVVNGAVLFTTRDNALHALAIADGRELWTAALGADVGTQSYWDFFTSAPIPFAGRVYVGSGDGGVYAIDPVNGEVVWRAEIGARVRSTPAATESTIVVGAQNGYVWGIDRRNGRVRWRFATDGVQHDYAYKHNDTRSVFASATIANGIVAIGGRDGQLYGLDVNTGRKRWQTTHDGESWILSTAAEDGMLYVGSGSATIVQAADMRTGRERWRFATDGAVFGSLSLSGDAVVFSDFGGMLHAVDRNNGDELWRFAMGDRALATPAVAEGVVYAASDVGMLYALDVADAAPAPDVRRYVFSAGRGPNGESWFQANIDEAIAGAFEAHHYAALDNAGLIEAMNAQIAGGERSVIVFADNVLPGAVRDGGAQSLLRRYLDAGGAVVFVSTNPVTINYDEHGVITGSDDSLAAASLDLHYAPRPDDYGYHVSHATREGERWGLDPVYVVNGVIPDDQVTTVLGRDEFGRASTWVRRYANAGMLIQLALPRNRVSDLSADMNVIDFALASGSP